MSKRAAPVVIKIGGSVLTGTRAYARAAKWLAGRVLGPPLLVVVSAENGVTDRLLAEAESIADQPDPRALDLLWSTGELRSAALLALHLQSIGVPACALNVHEAGLSGDGREVTVRTSELLRALESHAVVIVPGFLGATTRGTIVSLGRGGSDLSAVSLAAALGAEHCELIKDVPGYFTADPATNHTARHLPDIDIDAAITMAEAGCELVQAGALHTARDHRVRLVITTTQAGDRTTVVHTRRGAERGAGVPAEEKGKSHALCHENDSRRAAVGA